MKKTVLLLYQYYWPFYKAGGPVQSIYNIAQTFKGEVNFYLISKNRDIDGTTSPFSITENNWSKGPNDENVYYTSYLTPLLVYKIIRELRPQVILLNGLFNWQTTFFGVIFARLFGCKFIISPRGMLQTWALNRGKLKKRIFILVFKMLIRKRDNWHATDVQEQIDIKKVFGSLQEVSIAPNVPRPVSKAEAIMFPATDKKIKLVFLSLINPNKNLHWIIEAVNQMPDKFVLDIYGPIIDKNYWKKCADKIKNTESISYKGAIPPWDVSTVLKNYHFFVLPTEGENFGHAIFDALASGIPVIISKCSPWVSLDNAGAGFYLHELNFDSLIQSLNQAYSLTTNQYHQYRQNSLIYANRYISSRNYFSEYAFLLTR